MESDWGPFAERNLAIVAIAAQKIDGIFHGERFVQAHAYPFPVLFDETRQATRDYGVFHGLSVDAYRIARPAAFLLDERHVIQWIGVASSQTRWPRTKAILDACEKTIGASGKY